MNNTSENNTTERTETRISANERTVGEDKAGLWGIEPTDRGYKVNAQKLIERYIQSRPLAYAKSGFYYKYVKGVWIETDEVAIKKRLLLIVNHLVPYLWGRCGYSLNSSVSSLLPLLCHDFSRLTPATNFINLENGLLDLNTFTLKSHSKRFASLVQLPFNYDPKAECPRFQEFLRQVFREDKDLINLVQEIMGYCLSPSTEAQKFFIFYSDGSSGKSVLCSILQHLAGGDKNVSSVTLSNLNQKFQRAELYGKLLNISTENETSRFNTEALKSITSGDPIQIEHKFQKPFTTRLTAKLLFAMNSLPEPQDKTFAFYRRLVLVPFKTKFVDNPREGTNEMKRNPKIEEGLLEELPGILAWCIEGLKRLVENNYQFTRSQEADKLMLDYRKDISPVFSFIAECIEGYTPENIDSSLSNDERISTQDLFDAFDYWRMKNGIKGRFDKRDFLKSLREGLKECNIPFTESHSGNLRYFEGICLTQHAPRSINDFDDDLYDLDDFKDEGDYELDELEDAE